MCPTHARKSERPARVFVIRVLEIVKNTLVVNMCFLRRFTYLRESLEKWKVHDTAAGERSLPKRKTKHSLFRDDHSPTVSSESYVCIVIPVVSKFDLILILSSSRRQNFRYYIRVHVRTRSCVLWISAEVSLRALLFQLIMCMSTRACVSYLSLDTVTCFCCHSLKVRRALARA